MKFEISNGKLIEKSDGWQESNTIISIENENIIIMDGNIKNTYNVLKSEVISNKDFKRLNILANKNGIDYNFKIFKEEEIYISITYETTYVIYKINPN
jgi:hypothetical protein